MEWKYFFASLIYSAVGIVILGITFWIWERITPEDLWKEILEKQNMALALVASALMIALALIISSAIHG